MNDDIPYAQRQLTVYAFELGAPPWGTDTAAALIDVIASNRWKPVAEQHGKPSDPWVPFQREQAIALFAAKGLLGVRSSEDLALDGSLASSGGSNVARLSMMPRVFETGTSADVEFLVAHMIGLLPQPAAATASADQDQMMFKRERGLKRLPDLIRNIGWLQVLSPRIYPQYFDRAALLAAPCHRLEERPDGTIWIWAYAEPLHYDAPEARDLTAALHRHLASHALKLRT